MSDFDRILIAVDAVPDKLKRMFVGIVLKTKESIVEGSDLTGAPGQPVQSGRLRASWQEVFESDYKARVSTNLVYARGIEEGIGPHGPLTLRSEVGGFNSVKMTAMGMDRIVEAAVEEVNGAGPT